MLIAIDSNVLMDLAAGVEAVRDAIELVRGRISGARFIVLPAVIQELRYIAKHGEAPREIYLATTALRKLVEWGFEPVSFLPGVSGVTEQISLKLRGAGLLPETEVNDSIIMAEAALLDCGLCLTSDWHFLELDFQLLTLALRAFHVSVPSIASPRDIIRKFYR